MSESTRQCASAPATSRAAFTTLLLPVLFAIAMSAAGCGIPSDDWPEEECPEYDWFYAPFPASEDAIDPAALVAGDARFDLSCAPPEPWNDYHFSPAAD